MAERRRFKIDIDDKTHIEVRNYFPPLSITRSTPNQLQFKEAMKHGHVKVELGKMLLYGAAGSGKTSFKELVVGNPPPSTRESTPLAVRPATLYRINIEDKEWATLETSKERREFLANALIKRKRLDVDKCKRACKNITLIVFMFFLLQIYGFLWKMMGYSHPLDILYLFCWQSIFILSCGLICKVVFQKLTKSPTRLPFTDTDRRLIELMDGLSTKADEQPLTSFRMLQVIDSGGQPQFHEILPIFLHQLSFYIFVFRLCDDLASRPVVEFYENGKSIGSKYKSAQTTEQLLQHCVRTIQTQAKSKQESPQIVIVGTHLDLICNSNESLTVKNNKILKLLLHSVKDQIIYSNMVAKQVIFALNTKTPGEHDKLIIEQIRTTLLREISLFEADIPLRWYALEIMLEEIVTKHKRSILSKQECFVEAKQTLHFNENVAQFEAALEYLNQLSVLFYYPTVLPDVIFANTQAIIDKVTELVIVSFQMSEVSDIQVLTEEWRRFHEFALVTTKLLTKCEFNKHYVPGLFEAKDLVNLFLNLLIFARFSETEFFVPALLHNLNKQEIHKYRTSSSSTLVLQFPEGGPRQGVFCSLLCWLASPEYNSPAPWSILTDDIGVPVCLYRNCVKFELPNSPATVTLIDTYTHFEVHVHVPTHCSQDFCPKLYPTIKRQIFKGLHKTMLNLHYDSCTATPAFLCPCGMEEAHVATINAELSYWICSVCKEKCEKLSENQLLWLKGQQPEPNFSDTKQLKEEHLPDLLTTLQNHASKWRDIGTYLGFKRGELDNIVANQLLQPNISQSCIRAMLSEWLQWAPGDSRGSTSFATLEMLKSALTKSGLGATAQELSLKKLQ